MPTERIQFNPEPECAQRLDAADELASYRGAFRVPEPELIYLDGNSLGRLSLRSAERLHKAIEDEWAQGLIRSWNANWFDAPRRVGDQIGRLIGAAPGQVLVGDSTSVDLFKLALAALQARPGRHKIVSDQLNFPSDLHVLEGIVQLLGHDHQLQLVPSSDGITTDLDTLMEAIDEEAALVTLSHVAFKSAFMHDMAAVTERAHQVGALVLWDLSHSVGVVPIHLDLWGVDMAVGCTYKYLNGGPGSPAFLYLRQDLQPHMRSPIWGWFGQQKPFDFDLHYQPAEGISRFLAGTPAVLSLLAMEAALDIPLEAGVDRIRRKSVLLGDYLIALYEGLLAPLGFKLGSPRDAEVRGSHISLQHPEGYRITQALIHQMDVLPDFREPDNIRLGLAPLYTSFGDVRQAVARICRTLEEGRHLHYPTSRPNVT